MKREYKTTEFIALILMSATWLIDRQFGSDLFSQVDLATVDGARAEVLALAAEIRGEGGSNSNLLVYTGLFIYGLRKVEKVIAHVWPGDK